MMRTLNIYIFIVFHCFNQITSTHDTCGKREESYFSKTKGKLLVVSEKDILFERTVKRGEQCLGICRVTPDCKAINIAERINEHTCSFLKVDRLTLPLNFTDKEKHNYFEIFLPNEYRSVQYNRAPLTFARDCLDVYNAGYRESGVYNIKIGGKEVNVLCHSSSDPEGGGWTVIQLRDDQYKVDFNRSWTEYKNGFGDFQTEFWLGNEYMHYLTRDQDQQLVIDIIHEGQKLTVKYENFQIKSETNWYQLLLIGPGLSGWREKLFYHNSMYFTTKDEDHDNHADNCAVMRGSGWWFNTCLYVHLNGKHGAFGSNGMHWSKLTVGDAPKLSYSRMRLKRSHT